MVQDKRLMFSMTDRPRVRNAYAELTDAAAVELLDGE